MRSIRRDRDPHHQDEHTKFGDHGAHLFDVSNDWPSGQYHDPHQDGRGGTMDSVTHGLNSSPTSYASDPGSATASAPSALASVIGGDAYATGTNTDATGTVSNNVKDLGYATVASGVAVFEASATSSHGAPTAGADTFLSVTGADIVMEYEFDFNFHIGNKDVAVSELVYYAIDIKNWTPPDGPLVMDFQTHAAGQFGAHDGYLPSHVAPSGNLASVAAVADAQGPNSLASTLTHSLAVENHFSLVSGAAMVAA